MASNGKVAANPYARKRKNPPGTTTTTTSSSRDGANKTRPAPPPAVGLTAVPIGGATTFSQAFAAVEDTAHYKQMAAASSSSSSNNNNSNPQLEQERAQQRALDRQEKPQTVSDRDHHVLLQPHVLYVSTKQRGNGVLQYIKNVPYGFSKMVPDFIMSTKRCALFLSIKYHQLHPDYIHRRLGELKTDFTLRVLLVLVDVDDNTNAILYLNKLSVTHNLTLLLAWTEQEAARYLETFKAYDGKDASSIQKREQTNFVDQLADFLTAANPTNKTDAGNLVTHFSSLKAVMAASSDELALCPGMGNVKVQKLWDAFHKPFSKHGAAKRKRAQEQEQEQDATAEVAAAVAAANEAIIKEGGDQWNEDKESASKTITTTQSTDGDGETEWTDM
jgi:DNA excision repair protein ERCC-1